MRTNWEIALEGKLVKLVPYRREHVLTYHGWMQDPWIRDDGVRAAFLGRGVRHAALVERGRKKVHLHRSRSGDWGGVERGRGRRGGKRRDGGGGGGDRRRGGGGERAGDGGRREPFLQRLRRPGYVRGGGDGGGASVATERAGEGGGADAHEIRVGQPGGDNILLQNRRRKSCVSRSLRQAGFFRARVRGSVQGNGASVSSRAGLGDHGGVEGPDGTRPSRAVSPAGNCSGSGCGGGRGRGRGDGGAVTHAFNFQFCCCCCHIVVPTLLRRKNRFLWSVSSSSGVEEQTPRQKGVI